MMTILLKAGLRAQNSANKNLNTNLATNATIKFYLRISEWFSLHKLEALTKTFQHSKQWQPTSIVSALSLESVRTVNRYEVHKRPKTMVVFETSFLLAKPNGYLTFHGRRFSMGTFL